MDSKYLDYIEVCNNKVLTLIIYDIVDDKRRNRLARFLQGYGIRVQMSAFEAHLNLNKYEKLVRELPTYISNEDNVRIYRVGSSNNVKTFGTNSVNIMEMVVIA